MSTSITRTTIWRHLLHGVSIARFARGVWPPLESRPLLGVSTCQIGKVICRIVRSVMSRGGNNRGRTCPPDLRGRLSGCPGHFWWRKKPSPHTCRRREARSARTCCLRHEIESTLVVRSTGQLVVEWLASDPNTYLYDVAVTANATGTDRRHFPPFSSAMVVCDCNLKELTKFTQ